MHAPLLQCWGDECSGATGVCASGGAVQAASVCHPLHTHCTHSQATHSHLWGGWCGCPGVAVQRVRAMQRAGGYTIVYM